MDKRPKTSSMWSYLTVCNSITKTAKYDLCGLKMSYRLAISNLKNYISWRHPTVNCFNTSSSACGSSSSVPCDEQTHESDVGLQQLPSKQSLDSSSNTSSIGTGRASSGESFNINTDSVVFQIIGFQIQVVSIINVANITGLDSLQKQSSIGNFITKKLSFSQEKKLINYSWKCLLMIIKHVV